MARPADYELTRKELRSREDAQSEVAAIGASLFFALPSDQNSTLGGAQGKTKRPPRKAVPCRRSLQSRLSEGRKTVVDSSWWHQSPLVHMKRALIQDRLDTMSLRGSETDQHHPEAQENRTGLEAGLQKMKVLARGFDPGRFPNTIHELLQGGSMDEETLRRQVHKCLNLKLSKKEAGELLKAFDTDGNGTVEGTEFFTHFFRVGQEERQNHHMENVRKREIQREEMRRRSKEEERRQAEQNQAQVVRYTDEDRQSAIAKLTPVAVVLNPAVFTDHIAMSGFESLLTPLELKRQISVCLGVKLSRGELSAVIDFSDGLTRSGHIDGRRFILNLSQLGVSEREKVEEKHVQLAQRRLRRAQRLADQWW